MSKNLRETITILSKNKTIGAKKRSHEENVMIAIRQQIKEMVKNGLITSEYAEEHKAELIKLTLEKLKL